MSQSTCDNITAMQKYLYQLCTFPFADNRCHRDLFTLPVCILFFPNSVYVYTLALNVDRISFTLFQWAVGRYVVRYTYIQIIVLLTVTSTLI